MSPTNRTGAISTILLLVTTLLTNSCLASNVRYDVATSAFILPSLCKNSCHGFKERYNPHTKAVTSNYAGFPRIKSCIIVGRETIAPSSSAIYLARYDNLVSGIAEISMGFSLGVLWSEYAVITTGCGPLSFSDTLERLCYQGVIIAAGSSIFCRIAFGKDLESLCRDSFGYLDDSTLWQVRAAEILSFIGVVGAFVALGAQIANGENMDGLSGIDVNMCRAIRDL
uniref:Uncharacterized protein n=1 Tax=Ditylum brightwellii TaxID=49249 RepID=A0A6U3Z8Y1_9STRA